MLSIVIAVFYSYSVMVVWTFCKFFYAVSFGRPREENLLHSLPVSFYPFYGVVPNHQWSPRWEVRKVVEKDSQVACTVGSPCVTFRVGPLVAKPLFEPSALLHRARSPEILLIPWAGCWGPCLSELLPLNRSAKKLLVVVGGYDRGECLNSVESFDLTTNTWSALRPMLSARGRFAVAEMRGCLYACGGSNGQMDLCSAECYDPNTTSWILLPDMTIPRSYAGCFLCLLVLVTVFNMLAFRNVCIGILPVNREQLL